MPIIKYTPFGELADPFRFFDSAVNRLLNEPQATRPWMPAVDILETENELVLKADVPDVELKDIDIRIENGTLSLRGERKFEKKDEKSGFHRIERSYGSFERVFTIPETGDPDKVKAGYQSGVLTVTLPKKEVAKPRQIKVAINQQPN